VVATKILRTLNQPFEIAGNSFRISASIGIALYPKHGSDEKSLLKNADSAMYHAKNSGKNSVVFFDAGMGNGGR
jgi:diguanylate cyclase (GGDEF)-like protein